MRRRLFLIAMTIAATGCASAVYDSLERRGVDAKSVLAERVAEARADADEAARAVDAASAALLAAKPLDGAELARQVNAARARAQEAAVAAQALRLSTGSVSASADRYFRAWDDEIALYENADAKEAAGARRQAQADRQRRLGGALGAASLRLSPALTLINDEIDMLRKSPTSGVAVRSRADRLDAAGAAAKEASAALRAASAEADRFLASLNAAT